MIPTALFASSTNTAKLCQENVFTSLEQCCRACRRSSQRCNSKQWKLGRQQDAHQFLRYFLQYLLKSELQQEKLNPQKIRSSGLFKIFGGVMSSTVVCLNCEKQSVINQNFFDMALQIFDCQSLQDSLKRYFRKQRLGGVNKYLCSHCKRHSDALKFFKLQESPQVLTFQLKRFTNNLTKIGKKININLKVNLSPYAKESQPSYFLRSVIVHQGRSSFSGHYYSYVRVNNDWFLMDDSRVSRVHQMTILRDCQYILFYERQEQMNQCRGDQVLKASKQTVKAEEPRWSKKEQKVLFKCEQPKANNLKSPNELNGGKRQHCNFKVEPSVKTLQTKVNNTVHANQNFKAENKTSNPQHNKQDKKQVPPQVPQLLKRSHSMLSRESLRSLQSKTSRLTRLSRRMKWAKLSSDKQKYSRLKKSDRQAMRE